MIVGIILLVIGVIALLTRLGLLSGSVWSYAWPVILIILGLSLLGLGRRRSRWGWGCCGPWRSSQEDEKKQ